MSTKILNNTNRIEKLINGYKSIVNGTIDINVNDGDGQYEFEHLFNDEDKDLAIEVKGYVNVTQYYEEETNGCDIIFTPEFTEWNFWAGECQIFFSDKTTKEILQLITFDKY